MHYYCALTGFLFTASLLSMINKQEPFSYRKQQLSELKKLRSTSKEYIDEWEKQKKGYNKCLCVDNPAIFFADLCQPINTYTALETMVYLDQMICKKKLKSSSISQRYIETHFTSKMNTLKQDFEVLLKDLSLVTAQMEGLNLTYKDAYRLHQSGHLPPVALRAINSVINDITNLITLQNTQYQTKLINFETKVNQAQLDFFKIFPKKIY